MLKCVAFETAQLIRVCYGQAFLFSDTSQNNNEPTQASLIGLRYVVHLLARLDHVTSSLAHLLARLAHVTSLITCSFVGSTRSRDFLPLDRSIT